MRMIPHPCHLLRELVAVDEQHRRLLRHHCQARPEFEQEHASAPDETQPGQSPRQQEDSLSSGKKASG
jgi:hypothetical protein